MGVTRPPLEYLATCSKVALESFELSRLNEASNLRKEVQQILQGWIDTEVDARLARWILESKQAQAQGGLKEAMGQPVPLKQLDLSFLPPKGERTPDGEAEEDAARSNGPKARRAAHAALPSAAGRTPKENRNSSEKKPAKLVGRVVAGGGFGGGSAPTQPVGKPPFAQDEEHALQALERFVQCPPGTGCARPQNFAALGNPQILDGSPRSVGRGADRSRRSARGGHAEVRVFPSMKAMSRSLRRAHPFRPIAISALEPAMPAAVAHR
ncbi:MAG TPA: hypothetical protein VIY66_13505 [Candidatus Acidoferrales bacterium]